MWIKPGLTVEVIARTRPNIAVCQPLWALVVSIKHCTVYRFSVCCRLHLSRAHASSAVACQPSPEGKSLLFQKTHEFGIRQYMISSFSIQWLERISRLCDVFQFWICCNCATALFCSNRSVRVLAPLTSSINKQNKLVPKTPLNLLVQILSWSNP